MGDNLHILVTNDDGINSDGLKRLVEAAKVHGEVWVVAPDSQRSASSHSLTLHNPIEVKEITNYSVADVRAYSCSGTPADCVRVAIHGIMNVKPDVVISGINYGYNAGTDIQYSGTLGAALEGAFQGIHAIAFSESADPCHETSDRYLAEMLSEALQVKLGYGQAVNINFPHGPLNECKGVLRDRTISRGMFYADTYKKVGDKGDRSFEYMVDGKWTAVGEEGSDIAAIMDGYVSVGIVSNIQ